MQAAKLDSKTPVPMKHTVVFFLLIFPLLFLGCQDSDGRLTLRRANPDTGTEARAAIAQMNPIELDRCPVEIDVPRPTDIAISSNEPATTSAGSADDRATWQDKISQVMGGGGDIADEPAPASRSTASLNSNTSAERINRIDIRSRNSNNRIEVISGNSARLYTSGTAQVTREVPDSRGRISMVVDEGVAVDLVYNLINSTRGWTCSSVNVDVVGPPQGPSDTITSTRRSNPYPNRIGW